MKHEIQIDALAAQLMSQADFDQTALQTTLRKLLDLKQQVGKLDTGGSGTLMPQLQRLGSVDGDRVYRTWPKEINGERLVRLEAGELDDTLASQVTSRWKREHAAGMRRFPKFNQ